MRLTKNEYHDMTKKARKAGISTAAFVRMAIAGKEVMEAPSADVPLLIREVRRVGCNIDQILQFAHARGLMDVHEIRTALAENRAVEKMISQAYGVSWQ